MRSGILRSLTLLAFTITSIQAIDKEGLLSKYRDKFVVVANEGLTTGLCGEMAASPWIYINDRGEVELKHAGGCSIEPMHKGEVLKVSHISSGSGYLFIELKNVSPHSITRGIGTFTHESTEMGRVHVRVRAGDDGKDFDKAEALAARWLKPFDTAADAAKLGNTATGVFVNQVKAGMSFAEVESALGVPQTRVDLGEKVLYKYKDMTVEFHSGKVTDVR
jgi:hypothetical protein